jgi:hypothetical protein
VFSSRTVRFGAIVTVVFMLTAGDSIWVEVVTEGNILASRGGVCVEVVAVDVGTVLFSFDVISDDVQQLLMTMLPCQW